MQPHDSTDAVLKSDPRRLANVFGLAEGTETCWSNDELRALLAQQLSAPLDFEVGTADPNLTTGLASLSQAGVPIPKTLGELLGHSRPPLKLLELAKGYAKAAQKNPVCGVPREVATVLYYASIAAALVRCGQSITTLNDKELRQGLAWAVRLSWIDARFKGLLTDALGHLPD